jgi:MFS family permease
MAAELIEVQLASLFCLICLMGYPYAVLLPVFAAQVLYGGAATLGWLSTASGIGALISALSLAVRKSVLGLTPMLQIAAGMLGGALILFGLSHALWASLLLMICTGFGLMQGVAVSNTLIQSLVTEDKRARVMSYYTMALVGASPIGSLLVGVLAHHIGAPRTVMLTGAACIAGAIWFTFERPKLRAAMRPIYREMGLLPGAYTCPTSEVVARTARLASAFREKGLPVVLVNVNGMAPGRTEAGRPKFEFPPGWTELVPELEPQANDYLVTKQRVGAFIGTSLDAIFTRARRNSDCVDWYIHQRRRGVDGAQRLRLRLQRSLRY